MGGGAGGGSSDNRFARRGSSKRTNNFNVSGTLSNLISGATAPSGVTSFLGDSTQMSTSTPGLSNLINAANSFDPASRNFATDTEASFLQQLETGLAAARSGTENVLAPQLRGKAQREADVIMRHGQERQRDIRQGEAADLGLLLNSVAGLTGTSVGSGNALANILSAQGGMAGGLSNVLAPSNSTITDDLEGFGNQTNSQHGFSASLCCWVFLESYKGVMPKWVRECRDEFASESSTMRSGYRKFARWVVPRMQKSRIVRGLIWFTCVSPLTNWGGYYKKVEGYEKHKRLEPVKNAWFWLWKKLGESGYGNR